MPSASISLIASAAIWSTEYSISERVLFDVGASFTFTSTASAAPTPDGDAPSVDDKKHPLGTKRRAMRAQAMQEIMAGAPVYGKTHEVAHGQFVELERLATWWGDDRLHFLEQYLAAHQG